MINVSSSSDECPTRESDAVVDITERLETWNPYADQNSVG